MSQKRREKAKAKEKRHASNDKEKTAKTGNSYENRSAQEEKVFLRSSGHLVQMSPEWQQFYSSIRSAVKDMA